LQLRVIINIGRGEMGLGLEYFTVGLAALSVAIMGPVAAARADETPFASIPTTETVPQGSFEVEQRATWASSKPDERFDDVVGRTDAEYGVTNKLWLSLYANYSWTKIVPNGPGAPDGPVDTTRFSRLPRKPSISCSIPTQTPSVLPSAARQCVNGAVERQRKSPLLHGDGLRAGLADTIYPSSDLGFFYGKPLGVKPRIIG
jgi:hypothetical protein